MCPPSGVLQREPRAARACRMQAARRASPLTIVCRVLASLKLPSGTSTNMDLMVFKYGVRPEYEDDFCKKGGCWRASFGKSCDARMSWDVQWLRLVSSLKRSDFLQCCIVLSLCWNTDVCLLTKAGSVKWLELLASPRCTCHHDLLCHCRWQARCRATSDPSRPLLDS